MTDSKHRRKSDVGIAITNAFAQCEQVLKHFRPHINFEERNFSLVDSHGETSVIKA